MALNRKTKMRDIFENDKAYGILLKHIPSCVKDNPRMETAMDLSAQALLSFPQARCPREVREAFFAELESAGLNASDSNSIDIPEADTV